MPRKIRFRLSHIFTGILILAPIYIGTAAAEEVYVKDSLRVGVRANPGESEAVIDVVVTGMKLDVLESSGTYIKITGQAGAKGWIKRAYVTDEAPSIIQLQKLEEKHKSLQAQLAEHNQVVQAAQQEKNALTEKVKELESAKQKLLSELENVREIRTESNYQYLWLVGLLLLFVVSGFIAGVLWYRRQAMKRLGGFRL